jgi:hypothetical protein
VPAKLHPIFRDRTGGSGTDEQRLHHLGAVSWAGVCRGECCNRRIPAGPILRMNVRCATERDTYKGMLADRFGEFLSVASVG